MPAGPQKNKFMTSSSLNTCIRCGKTRIISKTWTEDVEMFFGKSRLAKEERISRIKNARKLRTQAVKR
ncbi:MAG: hypothetical protein UX86_C0049G0006 [Candidatus Amesbacteria bacterium GW2011_GWC1_47_15]|uniref:Uncharacterized protein n=1 Tax=Candidatus Amesbacteria bacterium GW2011_GWC1_47_15 TaxID=1618364 RepID=A0A0G1U877_9BACT|nr:MAG: hypothetical protein UX86_C0049G0006 [Candidatus Amesbacteria bacterium GW2011_GWC1_47_15]